MERISPYELVFTDDELAPVVVGAPIDTEMERLRAEEADLESKIAALEAEWPTPLPQLSPAPSAPTNRQTAALMVWLAEQELAKALRVAHAASARVAELRAELDRFSV